MGKAPAFDWVLPQLAVGGCLPIDAAAALAREHDVSLVVDLRSEACDDRVSLKRAGVELLHLPTDDHAAVAPADLELGVRRVAKTLGQGRRALIHCQHGIGRSALLALCVMTEQGLAPLPALKRLKAARACVSPSPAQYQAWDAWLRGRELEPPVFDDFAAVAYAHLTAG